MYRVIVNEIKQRRFGGLKFREVLDFTTDNFPAAAAEMSRWHDDRYQIFFHDNSAFLGVQPDFYDHGDGLDIPPNNEILDDELAEEEARLIDEINRQNGEVPF